MFKTIAALTGLLLAMFSLSNAAELNPGDPAPVATALTDAGTALNLADVYAKHPYTLVYFYPKADTPGCTAQACSLRDGYEALLNKGVFIIGVSTDDVAAQKAFKEKYHLPFTLLADTNKDVLKAFQVGSFLGFSGRQAFLIHDGKIAYVDHKGTTKEQAAKILEFLDGKP